MTDRFGITTYLCNAITYVANSFHEESYHSVKMEQSDLTQINKLYGSTNKTCLFSKSDQDLVLQVT